MYCLKPYHRLKATLTIEYKKIGRIVDVHNKPALSKLHTLENSPTKNHLSVKQALLPRVNYRSYVIGHMFESWVPPYLRDAKAAYQFKFFLFIMNVASIKY